MPSLGSDMEAGTLVAWKRAPGDAVKRGDVIAEVETEKGIIEVEVFEDGVVEELLITPGTKVPVGTPLARLRGAGQTEAPVPYAKHLEDAALPQPPAIVAAAREAVSHG